MYGGIQLGDFNYAPDGNADDRDEHGPILDGAMVTHCIRYTMKGKLRAIQTLEHTQHAIMSHASYNANAGEYAPGERLKGLQAQLQLAEQYDEWDSLLSQYI